MPHKPQRTIFIGLDAAERDLLIRWSDAGELPNIRKLRDSGVNGEVSVLPGFGSGAMWPSFATGVSPARHGRYFGHAPDAGYTVSKRPHEIRATSFWETLSEAGCKVAAINIPYARRSSGVNGIELFDWATHNPVEKEPQSQPRGLADEIVARYGTDPAGPCDREGLGQEDLKLFRDRLIERVERKCDMALDIFGRERWDMYAVVFDESHCVGHQTWHIHDPAHPEHDPELAQAIGDPVLQVYKAIDTAIGRLLDRADEDTLVMLASVTGMGPNYNANWMLEDMLRPLEDGSSTRLRVISMMRSAWRQLPAEWRDAIRRRARNFEERNVRAVERSQRKAYSLPHNDISGVIRLNVKGREPNGRLERGAEYDQYINRLIDHLRRITNAETGEPLISEIVEPPKIMSGKYIDNMPDLLVEWNRNAPIRRIHVPGIGELDNDYRGVRRGDHTTHGLLVARGPGIGRGRLAATASVMDLAPTLCAHLGVTLGDVEGRVIEELAPAAAISKSSMERSAGEVPSSA